MIKNDAAQELYRGVTSKGSLVDTTSAASMDKVTQSNKKVNENSTGRQMLLRRWRRPGEN
ncbi:MAG: hypothetical protein PUK05_05870 [Peptoniphilaceae bacterium]|nr:hypothetical protein [Peptoniphilaceae bacterium]